MWNQTYEIGQSQTAYSIIETSDGGYAMAGLTLSIFTGKTLIWVAKANMQGEIPEFPSWTILPLLGLTIVVVIVYRKKLYRKQTQQA